MTFRPSFSAIALVAFGAMTSAWAAGPCPTVGASTFQGDNTPYLSAGGGCNVVMTVSSTGTTVQVINSNPYDGSDDTLVGIVNSTSAPISQVTVSGANIAGWDGDGICVFGAGGAAGDTFTSGSSAYCSATALAGTDPQDYYGPNMTFTNFATGDAVTINFSPALAAGASTFFSLEEAPSSSLTVTTPVTTPITTTPAPASLYLAGLGMLALCGFYFYSRKTSRA
jgi:hypothetical protein